MDANFFPKIFQSFARLSRDGRANVANLSPRKFGELKLVSHWHANSSRLLREFSRGTFARHSCECRENFHVSRTSRELVAKVLNMFKNWMRFFFFKIFRKTVARLSCDGRDVRANVANLSPRNFGEFTMRNFRDTRTNVVRVSQDSRATVLRQHAKNSRLSGEKIKLSDIRTNVVRHSHECRATVARIKMKIRYIRRKVVRHSHECRATVVRQSGDYRATVVRYMFNIRPKFANLSHKCLFNETAT